MLQNIYKLIIFLNFFNLCILHKYKPVVLMHGVLTNDISMTLIAEQIQEKHPGTIVYNIARYGDWSSIEPMWRQVLEIGSDLLNISNSHPDGINVIGFSQGGLLARVILQTFPQHNVHNFISLSSPQSGQYGTAFLHLFFPNLMCKTAYELFYSYLGQKISVGNYWNDPYKQKLYLKYSIFLPFVNNDIVSNRSNSFREGIIKLKKMILIGGPDDGIITPWQSSQFGYFNENGTVVALRDRDIYKYDKIGLKTLDKQKRLHIIEVPNVRHFQWHLNISIIDEYLLPHLD